MLGLARLRKALDYPAELATAIPRKPLTEDALQKVSSMRRV